MYGGMYAHLRDVSLPVGPLDLPRKGTTCGARCGARYGAALGPTSTPA